MLSDKSVPNMYVYVMKSWRTLRCPNFRRLIHAIQGTYLDGDLLERWLESTLGIYFLLLQISNFLLQTLNPVLSDLERLGHLWIPLSIQDV